MTELATGGGTGIEDPLAWLQVEQSRRQLCRLVLHRYPAGGESGQRRHCKRLCQHHRTIGMHQGRGLYALGTQPLEVLLARELTPVYAQRHRRALVVGAQDRAPVIRPIALKLAHQPMRMAKGKRRIGAQLCEQHVFLA